MQLVSRHRLVAVTCGLWTLALAGEARAIDKYLDLDPPQTKSGVGYGYNSLTREFVLRQCVEFVPTLTEGGSGASGNAQSFDAIYSNSQLADEMGISVSTKFRAAMGAVTVGASAKVDFFENTITNYLTHTILASWSDVEPMRYIAGELRLKPEYLALVGTAAFRQKCGDYVIIGEQKGRWYYGTVQMSVKDIATESRLQVDAGANVEMDSWQASAEASVVDKMKAASKTEDLKIRVTSSGTDQAVVTIEEFLKQFKAFPGQNGPKQTYMLKAVPFESIVVDWPSSDPLAPLTDQQKLARLGEAAWGLLALTQDTDFVTQHAKLFALGTTPARRDARIAHMKARRAFYQAELNDMRNRAKTCDVDWDGTPACESLYQRWKDFEEFVVAEYDQFPIRYLSDCYAADDSRAKIQEALNAALFPTADNPGAASLFKNTRGDNEVGGGPVKFSAFLDFKPDHTGGDQLAVRSLLATMQIKMEEDGADHTTYQTTLRKSVFNLKETTLGPGAPVSLDQCSYRGTGVRADLVTDDPAACEGLKAFPAAYQSCKDAIAKNKHHGILRDRSGKDARDVTFNRNSRGVLSSIQCTVDSDGKDDSKVIGCKQAELRTVQLDLVNREDVGADKWVAPKTPDGKVTPKGIKPTGAYSKLAKKLATKLKFKRAKPASKCKAGLVAVGGECLPKLRR
jgi:hypothetical protein